MTEHMDVETVQGPDGAWYARIPDGAVLCIVSKDTAARYAEWTECAAFRLASEGGTVASIEVAPDLESLTAPEGKS